MSATDASVTTGPAEPTTRRRLDYLDSVRAIAAVYVLLHHIWITIWPGYPRNDGPTVLGWLVYGHLSVSVFIVVSGFSLAIAPARTGWVLRDGPWTFLRRRAWRIIPTYWAALALSCLVFGVITADVTGDLVSLKAVIVHMALLQDVVDSPKPNGAFWSIAVEWQIYFLFPLMLWIRRRLGVVVFLVLSSAGVIGAYLAATSVESLSRLLNLTPQFALLFALGVAGATVLRAPVTPRVRRLLAVGAGLGGAGLVAVCWGLGSVWVDAQYFWVDLLAGVATTCALAALACGGLRPLGRLLVARPLRAVGLYSYSVYCVHLPVLYLVWHFLLADLALDPVPHFLVLVAVGVPVVLTIAWAFSLVFERPFITHRSLASLRVAVREGVLVRRTATPLPLVTPSPVEAPREP